MQAFNFLWMRSRKAIISKHALQGNRVLDAPIDVTFVLFLSAATVSMGATGLDSSMMRLHRRIVDALYMHYRRTINSRIDA